MLTSLSAVSSMKSCAMFPSVRSGGVSEFSHEYDELSHDGRVRMEMVGASHHLQDVCTTARVPGFDCTYICCATSLKEEEHDDAD